MFRTIAPLFFAGYIFFAAVLMAEDVGIRAPEGFEVTLFAGDDLAHDINSMTIDGRGRVVVAGQGYVKILHDEDNDGKADKATLFSEFPKSGAHGMVFVGNDLIATGDNLLMRLKDEDGNGVADGKPIPLANVRSPEHGANGLVHGPDGWIYMICGNDAGIGAQFARTKTSPVKKPQAGTVVRFSPDFKTSEIFAHGFRNPYDLTFNANGQLFTVDADGERDQYLPWYTPTRLFDIQQGMHHGWVQRGWTRSWNRPECFFDNVERLVEVGRGSPTGVECYRHYAFPSHYRGGIYSCCWTLGTVYYFPLERDGASYKSHKEIFLQTSGDVGFAPVDIAVGPDGDMFVAIGGRGTRGSVFRVRYTGKLEKEEQYVAKDGLAGILNAPQPLSAWSRAKWMPLARKLDNEDFERAAISSDLFSASERVRSLEILTELHGGIAEDPRLSLDYNSLLVDENYGIVARAIWSAGYAADEESVCEYAASLINPLSTHGAINRAAWETLAKCESPSFVAVPKLWEDAVHQSRRVRSAALQVAGDSRVDPKVGDLSGIKSREARSAILQYRAMHGLLRPEDFDDVLHLFDGEDSVSSAGTDQGFRRVVSGSTRPLQIREDDVDAEARMRFRLSVIRMLQICLGDVRVAPMRPDVYAGYTANAAEKVPQQDRLAAAKKLTDMFPTDDPDTNREIARTMGMLQVDGDAVVKFAEKLSDCWDLNSTVQDDIHYLIVLSRLPGERSPAMTKKTAGTLAFLHMKMLIGEMFPSRNWPLRVGETFVELCKHDPKLAAALASHRDFGLPSHAMFARLMPPKEQEIAVRRMFDRAKRSPDEVWTPDMVALFAQLNDEEVANAIRDQWHNYALRDAIIGAIHAKANPRDRQLFVDALKETNTATVTRAANALASLGEEGSADEIAAALTALRHQSADKKAVEVRQAIAQAIRVLAKEEFTFAVERDYDILLAYRPAFNWFAKTHQEASAELNRLSALDGIDWDERIAKIDFTAGDVTRGKRVYESQSCGKCHSGRNRLGPALEGVTGRWSRVDLIKEIVDPNRNVAPQFLTSRLETKDGKVYQGMPVYQSPDGTLLQTGPNETIRIAGPEVISISKSRTSLMPTGLLRGLSDEQIADLYAYLKTLTVKPQ